MSHRFTTDIAKDQAGEEVVVAAGKAVAEVGDVGPGEDVVVELDLVSVRIQPEMLDVKAYHELKR